MRVTAGLPKGTRTMEHGTECYCGSCGYAGRWDVMEGGIAEFDDAIWFNTHEGHIECHECWLK